MIKDIVLNHGLRYVYRSDLDKLNGSHAGLRDFLSRVSEGCHEKIFLEGARSSALKFDLGLKVVRVEGHEVCSWAKLGLMNQRFRDAHSNVQVYMLENDAKTIAVEVPVWLKQTDLVGEDIDDELYARLFADGVLTGHIDIVAIDNGSVWIWDYKPNADKEKYAATQVYFYALMLSRRTGIPLEKFKCGYFDDRVAYLFKP